MSNQNQLATTTPKVSPLTVMAARFNADPARLLETLKATVFKDARNNEELQALVIVANEYNLNPLTKEIYAFPAKGGGITPVISIDGWANLANSHPQMDGMDFEWQHDGGKLVSCTCVIYRKDRSRPVRVTEYLAECKRGTEPWKMEHRMLRHKALSQCVRIAFGFSGVYDEDEARDIAPMREVTAARVPATTALFTPPPAIADSAPETLFSDEVPATPLLDQLRQKIATAQVKPSDVIAEAVKGLGASDVATLDELSEDELRDILGAWSGIEAALKKGGAGK